MGVRPWICLSSSSGQTFRSLWQSLSPEIQASCQGFFTDRNCEATQVARELLGDQRVFTEAKKDIEARVLKFCADLDEPLVLLCGYFGILTANFLNELRAPVVNTHPSLLPSFPGLDKKVHQQAVETVAVTGFTVHLVTEFVDGGTILFQHPVWVNPDLSVEGNRQVVRQAEQYYLPRVWEAIVRTTLNAQDIHLNAYDLRKKLGLNKSFFADQKTSRKEVDV